MSSDSISGTNPFLNGKFHYSVHQVTDNDVIPMPIGYEIYSFGSLIEIHCICPEHGTWVFLPGPEGRTAAAEFTAEHAGHVAPPPRPPRPPNKHRRKA